jgi:hypothetical protein
LSSPPSVLRFDASRSSRPSSELVGHVALRDGLFISLKCRSASIFRHCPEGPSRSATVMLSGALCRENGLCVVRRRRSQREPDHQSEQQASQYVQGRKFEHAIDWQETGYQPSAAMCRLCKGPARPWQRLRPPTEKRSKSKFSRSPASWMGFRGFQFCLCRAAICV